MQFELVDSNDVRWFDDQAIFWRELPLTDEGEPWPEYPDEYFVLSSTEFDNLLSAHQAMKVAMENKFLALS